MLFLPHWIVTTLAIAVAVVRYVLCHIYHLEYRYDQPYFDHCLGSEVVADTLFKRSKIIMVGILSLK